MLKLPASDWKLDHVEADSADLEVTQDNPLPNGEIRFHLKQKIIQTGNAISKVKIVVKKSNQEKETVPVDIRYYGKPN